ncbi:GNAT family N-acetyltransferase [Frigidibacter sp. RF13]|uniref:GNAT family N-acetyltransferase n=1 Tax=Frigidibacter sp. RF13 TaxID=2997340 RepID=UPI00226E1267|nr:GNAT family N-acetyltransferase [Frigidibacter sp. RF13]MCY1125993.1 GNAT family N-acetyltransferase [Frigidibacter sp. RF13]
MNDILSRAYEPSDFDRCLSIFDGNLPDFFDPTERAEFIQFLHDTATWAAPYLVLEFDGLVIACGGLERAPGSRCAGLSWGMVDRPLHGTGLGTQLTEARLALARALPGIDEVILSTSQHTRGFYERFGFAVTQITRDGFGQGLDRCDMRLSLA